jgi:hypothetical protein
LGWGKWVDKREIGPLPQNFGFQIPLKPPHPKIHWTADSPESPYVAGCKWPCLARERRQVGRGEPRLLPPRVQQPHRRREHGGPEPADSAPQPPRARPRENAGPRATYRACKPENRQSRSSSFGAMVRWSAGAGPRLPLERGPWLLQLSLPRCLGCGATRDRCRLWLRPRPRRPEVPGTARLRGAHAGCRRVGAPRCRMSPCRRGRVAGAGARRTPWPRSPSASSAQMRPQRWKVGQRGRRSSGGASEAVPAGRSFPNYMLGDAQGEDGEA